MRTKLVILLIVVGLILSFAAGFYGNHSRIKEDIEIPKVSERNYKEVSRVKSPDGRAEAILVEVELPESLLGNGFILYISRPGIETERHIKGWQPTLFYAQYAEDLRLNWKESDFLEIKYKRASVLAFRNNFWMPEENGARWFELRLVPDSERSLPFQTDN